MGYDLRKERNFIVAYNADNTALAYFNVLTSEYFDEHGELSVVKPHALYANKLNETPLSRAFTFYCMYMRKGHLITANFSTKRAARFEQFISLGLIPDGLEALDTKFALKKDFVEFCKNNYDALCGTDIYITYRAASEYGHDFNILNDKYRKIFTDSMNPQNKEENQLILKCLRICQHEYVDTYLTVSSIWGYIKEYISLQRVMYNHVEIKPNFLTNCIIIQALYEQYKQTHYDDILRKNNDKAILYFENDEYVAFPLLTRQQFHDEAEEQHNCVERYYMNSVFENELYIVAVREKHNPNHAYVTCEVRKTGTIGQFLAACNQQPQNKSVLNFKKLYEQHLKKNWA